DGETMDEFEERLFGGKDTDKGSLYEKLDRAENTGRRYNFGLSKGGFTRLSDSSSSGFPGFPASSDRSSSGWMDGYDSFNDGLNDTIANAARNIQMEEDEDVDGDWEDDFEFRPDVRFRRGSTYSVRDLDLRKPAAAKNPPRRQFETTTAEVLKKADFRNVRFLSNFLTEAGIIIKRSQTRISAKAQRKIAREIKTARAFGLMPFTTMGRRPFFFGRSAEEHYSDDGYFGFVKQKDGEPVENEDAEPNVEAVFAALMANNATIGLIFTVLGQKEWDSSLPAPQIAANTKKKISEHKKSQTK
ncbi:hypothetical protein ACJX0J_017168, partial [Zea mays]